MPDNFKKSQTLKLTVQAINLTQIHKGYGKIYDFFSLRCDGEISDRQISSLLLKYIQYLSALVISIYTDPFYDFLKHSCRGISGFIKRSIVIATIVEGKVKTKLIGQFFD